MTDFIAKKKALDAPIPVTLLSGFLGAGKTTLLMDILRNKQQLKCAIIVNDMSSLNIDASIVEKAEILQRKEEMVQMQNGCICCTLRGDLLKEISGIAKSKQYDYLIIESTGISEPMQVAETFAAPAEMLIEDGHMEEEGFESLVGIAKLDTCVTVVDAASFFDYMENTKFLKEELADGKEDDSERTVANLLVEQVEFANVIIVNKASLISKETLARLKGFISQLNPSAEIITTNYSKVPLKKVLNTGKFDLETAKNAPGWLKSLTEEHTPETIEYGISSFLYNGARPFHSDRLFELFSKYFLLLETTYQPEGEEENNADDSCEEKIAAQEETEPPTKQICDMATEDTEEALRNDMKFREERAAARSASHWHGVMRSKGYFWLATRPHQLGTWAQAGTMLNIDCAGTMGAAEDDDDGSDDEEEHKSEEVHSTHPMKRRSMASSEAEEEEPIQPKQELVFIGNFTEEEKKLLLKDLDNCLLSDAEMALFENGDLSDFTDPWEPWPSVDEDDEDDDHAHCEMETGK